MSRPEHLAPPEIFYNSAEARKYSSNSRMMQIQSEMTQRALELLQLPSDQPSFLLDIGCGSGLSGEELSEEGHIWVGVDISEAMLQVALEREVEGDLFLQDMGQGICFRPGVFDGIISISALQWLCNADKKCHFPRKRLQRFFETIYMAMAQGARAVFQFYPESPEQIELINTAAMRAGFTGGLVIDYPNSTKAKKYFLCLFAGLVPGHSGQPSLPRALGTDQGKHARKDGDDEEDADKDEEDNENGRTSLRRTIPYVHQRHTHDRHTSRFNKERHPVKDKAWVLRKKEMARRRGQEVAHDSKYTARKRRPHF